MPPRRLLAFFTAVALCAAAVVLLARREALVPPEPPPVLADALPPDAPNLVLVIGCTVRKDQLTPYGGPAETTPFLARLAGEGTRFADLIGASTWTRESSTALLTGQHALTLGLPEPKRKPSQRVLPEEAVTLAEHLANAGYVTLGQTANPNLNRIYGMDQGFHAYGDTALKGFALRNKRYGDEVVADALTLLDQRVDPARPFFLQVLLIDPHTPRDPRPEDLARFEEPGLPPLVVEYRAMLRRLDQAVRQLDEGLTARGVDPDNTLFVFVADHGEGLKWPPHHRGGHGKMMYPSTAHIPWILRGPGVPAGQVVDGLASQVDVSPTLLGLLGLPAPTDVAGRDWSEQVHAAPSRTSRTRAYSSSWFHGANIAAIWTADRQCQQDYGSVGTEPFPLRQGCFDRHRDPDFVSPFPDPGLLAELEAWREARLREFEPWPTVEADPSDDVGRQLEALGYVDEG